MVIERDMVHSLFDTVEDKKSGRQPLNDITSFTVTDNGAGFNDDNFNAFLTLDTDHKIDKGGRGIGRLLWLKAFQRVDVASVCSRRTCTSPATVPVFNRWRHG